ncbi:MAG: ribosome assembly factor SBDS [Candidatus Aenigmarchaeota archaeon]|nr:ribosome assembly factor SBDS [Candidatus Aenigmarchaeota archaeon]
MSISVDKAVIAKYIHSGEKFEILVDPEKAIELKSGKELNIEDIVAVEEVFEDAKKGLRASEQKINKVFGTNDFKKIARKIILNGEIQLTTEQRTKLQAEKEKAIAALISRQGINPQTGAPHPIERILKAMKEAKVRVLYDRPVEEQVSDVLKSIQKIIPIKIEKVKLAIKIPSTYASKSIGIVRGLGNVLKEEWGSDGSYICLMEISAGIQSEVYDKLNLITHGDVQIKVMK